MVYFSSWTGLQCRSMGTACYPKILLCLASNKIEFDSDYQTFSLRDFKKSELYTCYNKYYIGKVCSGKRSKAFGLATTTTQLLMRGSFICKTSYRARTIYLSIQYPCPDSLLFRPQSLENVPRG